MVGPHGRLHSTSPEGLVMRIRKAFTLVELLVVIGIIALLIGILLPALNQARQQALQLKCQSNLHSMGLAMTMYINQYHYYPGHVAKCNGTAVNAAVWPVRLRNMMGNRPGGIQGIFLCPAREAGFQWQVTTSATAGTKAAVADERWGYNTGELLLNVFTVPFSYAYNDWGLGNVVYGKNAPQRGLGGDLGPNWGGQTGYELAAGKVRVPSDMIAIADNTPDGSWDYNLDPEQSDQWPGKIHKRGSNVLFADGHVEWYLQKELIDVGTSPSHNPTMRRKWSNDNRP